VLADLVMERRGLILIVGATGSGKSTTLASMLDHRNTLCSGHILTIEDPIEYLFRHKKSLVNQREIGMDTLGWENALKNAMRQAPDCILIGEIRDRETMQAAIAYAQTGHLCLGTLHANNSYHALNRAINFFPLDSRGALYMDLSVSLKAIVSQRLVKKKDGKLTPAVEVLLNSYHVQELIEAGDVPALKEAMEQSLAPGSQTFEQDLFRLYRNDVITLQEALLNADSPTNLSWLINNHEATGNLATGSKAARCCFRPVKHQPWRPFLQGILPQPGRRRAAVGRNPQMSGDSSRIAATGDATVRLAEQLIACRSVTPEDAGCLAIISQPPRRDRLQLRVHQSRPCHQPLGAPRRPQPAALSCRPHRRRPQRTAR
jgi:ABC-type cobalamin/Fe3+-siderophores transport system ATPase subunit